VRPLTVVVPQVLVEHPLKMTPTPRAPSKCRDGRCGWSDRMNVRQAREPQSMRFSSPHDLTDTRACRPIIPIPAAVTDPDDARPLAVGECPGLLQRLAMIPDPRDRRGRRHTLASVLAVSAVGEAQAPSDVAGEKRDLQSAREFRSQCGLPGSRRAVIRHDAGRLPRRSDLTRTHGVPTPTGGCPPTPGQLGLICMVAWCPCRRVAHVMVQRSCLVHARHWIHR
jgi:hypothetical protein